MAQARRSFGRPLRGEGGGIFNRFRLPERKVPLLKSSVCERGLCGTTQSDHFFSPTQHYAATGVMGTDVVGNSRSRCRIVNFLTVRCKCRSFALGVVPQRDTKNGK